MADPYWQTYIALMQKQAGTDYGVAFPDFPGCITAGKTLDEAHRFAVEALSLHIEGMVDYGEPIPEPAALESIMADPHHRGMIAFLVKVPRPRRRMRRLNITMDADLVDRIDARVGTGKRSAFLAEGAARLLDAEAADAAA